MVRLPDKRGRIPMGADNFGSGSGGRIPTEVAAGRGTRGSNGGEERHTTTAAELPAHSHTASSGTESADHFHSGSTDAQLGSAFTLQQPAASSIGSIWAATQAGQFFNVPYANNANPWGAINLSHSHGYSTGGKSATHTHTITVNNSTGGGGSHQNLQPYEADNYIVRIR